MTALINLNGRVAVVTGGASGIGKGIARKLGEAGLQVVVADTSPLNYLVLIGHVDILSALFERVFVPAIVRDELQNRPQTFSA